MIVNNKLRFLKTAGIIFFVILSFSYISCSTFIDSVSDVTNVSKSNDRGFLVLNFDGDSFFEYMIEINNLDNKESFLFPLIPSVDEKDRISTFDKTLIKRKKGQKLYLTIIPLKAGKYQFTGAIRSDLYSKFADRFSFSGNTVNIQSGKATYIGKISADLMVLLFYRKCEFSVVDNSDEDLADLSGKIEVIKQIMSFK